MKRSKLSALAMAGLATAISAGAASAATISYTDSIPMTTTNWGPGTPAAFNPLAITKFDASLGTLNSIKIILNGEVLGNIKVENFDSDPQTVTATLQATVTLTRPDSSTLVAVIPAVSKIENLPLYDGAIDYLGTSGKTYIGEHSSTSDSVTLTSASDKALFTGSGSIFLPVTAAAGSIATGSGNYFSGFQTSAAADATVIYDYTAAVPLPAAAPAGLGLLGVVAAARRFKAARSK